MCGISGVFDLQGQRAIDQARLERMNDIQLHRGPDGSGVHIGPGIGLAHRRLSIIDVGGGAQPIYNEDNTVAVTYNGEIYNFKGLVTELAGCGHRFRTRCDTEVIVHAWEEWGPACLDRFNGMFGFAIWDDNSETLFVARDRIGIKPIYYGVSPDGFLVFGSELKTLCDWFETMPDYDGNAVEDYFTFGYVPEPRTIYKNVYKLPPGHYLKVTRNQGLSEPVQYWDVPLDSESDPQLSFEDAGVALRDELQQAVNRRLVADVPLGAFLSGGIDSSAVVSAMRDSHEDDLLTCSIGFTEKQYDESRYADMVAQAKRTNHKAETVASGDYSLLDKLVGMYDEPYADSSAIPTYRVCELARKHVTVALSGDGGDENYIGYRRYQLFNAEESVRQALPSGLRKAVFEPLGRYYPKLDWAPRFVRGKTTFQALARSSSEAYLHGVSIMPNEMRQKLFSEQYRQDLAGYSSSQVFAELIKNKEFEDPLRMVQYLDFKTYLPGDILTKVDRASMAHSLEVRVPFLDHTFVEWASRVPTAFKLRKGEGKAVLKRALEPKLPHEVLYRKKMGFAVPLDLWFRDSLQQRMRDAVTGERLKSSGFFKPEALDQLVEEHTSGRRNHSAPLWSLLMFDGFLKSRE